MSEARTTPRPQPQPQHLSRCQSQPKQPLHLATIPCLHPPVLVIGPPPGRSSQRRLPALRFRRQATLTPLSSASLSPSSLWLSPNLEVAPQPGRSVPDSLLKMTMVQHLPLAATTSRRSWMTDLSTTRGRPRESAVKTLEVELLREAGSALRAGTGAGKPGCREPAAGKGLRWSRALVTLNPLVASMALVWRGIMPQRTEPETELRMGRGLTSSCPRRTRSGSEGCSKKSHISGPLPSELRVST